MPFSAVFRKSLAAWLTILLPLHLRLTHRHPTPLVEEALERAVERDVNGVPTRVFTAECLAAICLQVGRPKDHDRIIRFVEAEALDAAVFDAILRRHALNEQWQTFQQRHLQP